MDDTEKQSILDTEHLRLLRIGYFVSAGVTGLLGLFGIFYVIMGIVFSRTMSAMPFPNVENASPPPVEMGHMMGLMFGFIGLAFVIVGLGMAALQIYVAQSLSRRRSLTLCRVVAGIGCLWIPYGTLLGIATFMVLGRSSVERLFKPAT